MVALIAMYSTLVVAIALGDNVEIMDGVFVILLGLIVLAYGVVSALSGPKARVEQGQIAARLAVYERIYRPDDR
jgi:hypothetical protein